MIARPINCNNREGKEEKHRTTLEDDRNDKIS